MTSLGDHRRLIRTMFAAFGRIDCLADTAGVPTPVRGDRLDVAAESDDLNFTVNTRAAFFLTRAVCRRMIADDPPSAESGRPSRSMAACTAIDTKAEKTS